MSEKYTGEESLRDLVESKTKYGEIKVVDRDESEPMDARSNSSFRIEFISGNNTVIELGTRKASAFILKQLIENFGKHIEISQYRDPSRSYANGEILTSRITALNNLIEDSGLIITREHVKFSSKFKISKRSDSNKTSNFELAKEDWKEKVLCETEYGSISIKPRGRGKNEKRQSNYTIQFSTPDNQIIDLGTRKAASYALSQLLKNFGNYTELYQLENDGQVYKSKMSIYQKVISPLTMKLQDSNLAIEKEPGSHNLRYRIFHKTESIENPDQQEM